MGCMRMEWNGCAWYRRRVGLLGGVGDLGYSVDWGFLGSLYLYSRKMEGVLDLKLIVERHVLG